MKTLSRLSFAKRCDLYNRILTKAQIYRNRGVAVDHPIRVRFAAIRERAFRACMSA